MVQTERSTTGPSSQKATGRKGNFSSLALAFAIGAVLSAWGTYILTQSLSSQQNPPPSGTLASTPPSDAQKQKSTPSDKSDKAKKDSEKSASPANAADKATDFDPSAEATRINELNRRNRERMAGPAAGPAAPGARQPDGSAIPNPSAAPGTYGPTVPQAPED